MLFNSYIFILVFLPIVFAGWFLLNRFENKILAKIFLLCMSLWFYSYAHIYYLFLILISVCGNYLGSYVIEKLKDIYRRRLTKIIGFILIIFNISILFYFKYYDFFISNINILFSKEIGLLHIALPLGISFFTFQQISFVCDRITGKSEHYKLIDYMIYVTYFPQLVAGPIVKHSDLIPQFNDNQKMRFNIENFARGIVLIIIGLSKKVIIADSLSLAVDYGYYNLESLDTLASIIVMLMYTMQIFFDFSGYCDIALGVGKAMNIDLPQNFNSPYKSISVKEFWNRWHITLNRFFTEYVYIPLGGNRKGKIVKTINILIVFSLSGLWHGAAWTFVIWGVLHGIMVSLEKPFKKIFSKKYVAWFMTFVFVNLSWILFRSEDLSQALMFYKKIFAFTWNGSIFDIACSLDTGYLYVPLSLIKHFNSDFYLIGYMCFMILLVLLCIILCMKKCAKQYVESMKYSTFKATILIVIFIFCISRFSSVTSFLYFNF